MRRCLLALLVVSGCAASSDEGPPVPTFSDGKADGSTAPACSLEWWGWLNNTYLPMLDRPATEVTAEDLKQAAAAAPPMGETQYTYSLCYQGAFNKYVFAPAAMTLHSADTTYVDHNSPDYLKYDAYLSHAAASAELVRNAAAIAAIKPSAMNRDAYETWMVAYSSVLMPIVAPLGLPGPSGYLEIQENEWVFDAPDKVYASMLEAGLAPSNQDGSLDAWLDDYNHWLFTGGNNGNSMVFNLNGEYGCRGVALDSSGWYLSDDIKAFLSRYQATRPKAMGDYDQSKWMSLFHGYGLRMAGDSDPQALQLDDLMLQTIEQVKPDQTQGLFPYQTWLELEPIATEPTLHARVMAVKPCLAAADLDAANASFQMANAAPEAAPATCTR